MARKRTIDPDSWTDDKVAELSIGAHLLWIGLISIADDEGRLQWNARQFKARLFPAKDDVTAALLEAWMAELTSARGDNDRPLIVVYGDGRSRFAYHPNWRKHQYVNRPTRSKLPEPLPIHETYTENSEHFHEDAASLTESSERFTEESRKVRESHVPSVSVSVSVSDTVSGESNAREFARWFCQTGVAAGVISEVDVELWARRNEQGAMHLLGLYPVEQCQLKAERLFAVIAGGKLRRTWATPARLVDAWEFTELAQPAPESGDGDWLRSATERGRAS